jgi:hypothetical protein
MSTHPQSSSTLTTSLNERIREAGDRLHNRRRSVRERGATLGRTLHQRITDPTLLWWAGGIGFLFGELTRPTPQSRATDRPPDSGHSFFERALNLLKLVNWGHTYTLFTALSGARSPPREPPTPSGQHHPTRPST